MWQFNNYIMLLSNLLITDIQFCHDLAGRFDIETNNVSGDTINQMISSIYEQAISNAGFEGEYEIDANSIASSLNVCLNGVWETVYSANDFAELLANQD